MFVMVTIPVKRQGKFSGARQLKELYMIRLVVTFEGLKLTFLALPCSSPDTAGWLLNPCFTFRAVNSS